MSNRLDKEREAKLQPKRWEYATGQLMKRMLPIVEDDGVKVVFLFKGERVTIFPYSGWCSGKSITDCRGIENLLKQIDQ